MAAARPAKAQIYTILSY